MLGHVTLHEHRRGVRIQTCGKQLGSGNPSPAAELSRLLRKSDRVQVDYAVEGVVGLLQGHPLAQRTQVIADVEGVGCRLDAGEHAWSRHTPQSSLCAARRRADASLGQI